MLYKLNGNTYPITDTSIMVASRRYVDLLDPLVEVVDVDDLALGLEAPRFRRQTTVPISIADHSLRVARLALAVGEPLTVVLACLLHDAPEGYLGDMPGPLKKHVRVELKSGAVISWAELESTWSDTICRALLPDDLASKVAGLIDSRRGPVSQYDHMALRAEALLWMPGAEDWAQGQAEPTYRAPLDPRVWPAMLAPRESLTWGATAFQVARDAAHLDHVLVLANLQRALGVLR